MTSVWPGLGVPRGRGGRRPLTEEGSPPPGALDALRARLGRRRPLGSLQAPLGEGPPWEPLESPDRGAARCARKKSCQGSGQRTDSGCAHKGSPHPTRRRSARQWVVPSPSCGARHRTSSPSSRGPGLRRLSKWLSKDPLLPLRRRSQREAALRSPYSSPAPLCPTRGGCSEEEEEEMESVTTGLQQLKHLSQAFDEAIASDERKQTIAHYHLLMTHNLRAMHQAARRPWASGRRQVQGRR